MFMETYFLSLIWIYCQNSFEVNTVVRSGKVRFHPVAGHTGPEGE